MTRREEINTISPVRLITNQREVDVYKTEKKNPETARETNGDSMPMGEITGYPGRHKGRSLDP